MTTPNPRIRIGLLVTTQDRYELSYMALTTALNGVDTDAVDLKLLWLDGSTNENSLAFFHSFKHAGITIQKVGGVRGIGPAGAIQQGMNLLTQSGDFDWVGMFESDCYFFPGWLQKMLNAAESGERAGLSVGAVTPLANLRWLLFQCASYNITEVLPASCSLFRLQAWKLVPPASIAHMFPTQLMHELWNIPRIHSNSHLGWDWIFAPALWHGGGFVSVATPRTQMLNCGIPEHYKMGLPGHLYGDEFLPTPTASSQPPRPSHDTAAWNRIIQLLQASADYALIATESLTALSYLDVHFIEAWHEKELDATRWWRWSAGHAAMDVINGSKGHIKIRLVGELMFADAANCVRISMGERTLAICSPSQPLFDAAVNLQPGHNAICFTPSVAAEVMADDPRKLSFAITPNRRLL